MDSPSAFDQVVNVRQRIEPTNAVVDGIRKKEIAATFERGIPEQKSTSGGGASSNKLDRVLIVQHAAVGECRTRLDEKPRFVPVAVPSCALKIAELVMSSVALAPRLMPRTSLFGCDTVTV